MESLLDLNTNLSRFLLIAVFAAGCLALICRGTGAKRFFLLLAGLAGALACCGGLLS